MTHRRIAPERRERAIMHLLPPYNWSLRQIADDTGAVISTVHQWRKQLEMERFIAQKHELTGGTGSWSGTTQAPSQWDKIRDAG